MTDHERLCFHDALHKVQVRDAELRVRRKLEHRLQQVCGLTVTEQLPHLKRLEEALA